MKFVSCQTCKIKSSAAETLSKKELERLENNCVEVNFKKGDIIFKQGAFSSNIIYLKAGLVKQSITGPKAKQIIKITKAQSYLGIPTTFHEKINQYSATAIDNTTVCFIDNELFRNFVQENGKFAYEIIVDLCRNEVNSYIGCVNRTQKNVNGRLADALLFFYNEIFECDVFTLPLKRSELGNFIDSTRESVSRVLTEFHNEGIIKLKGKNIKILNKDLLEMISRNG